MQVQIRPGVGRVQPRPVGRRDPDPDDGGGALLVAALSHHPAIGAGQLFFIT